MAERINAGTLPHLFIDSDNLHIYRRIPGAMLQPFGTLNAASQPPPAAQPQQPPPPKRPGGRTTSPIDLNVPSEEEDNDGVNGGATADDEEEYVSAEETPTPVPRTEHERRPYSSTLNIEEEVRERPVKSEPKPKLRAKPQSTKPSNKGTKAERWSIHSEDDLPEDPLHRKTWNRRSLTSARLQTTMAKS